MVFLLLEAIALVLFFNNNQQPSSSLYEFGTAIKGRFLSIGGDVRSKDELKAENLELQKENAWLRHPSFRFAIRKRLSGPIRLTPSVISAFAPVSCIRH